MTKSWRENLRIHPAAELFPLMPPEELRALGEDIKKNGLTTSIVLWAERPESSMPGEYALLDGRNRLDAMEAVGLPVLDANGEFPDKLRQRTDIVCAYRLGRRRDDWVATGIDPYEYTLSLNVHRRHLTAEQKRELVAKVLQANPERSNRRIADLAKVDHKTVGTVRAKLEATGEIPQLKGTVGADNKQRTTQPARKAVPGGAYRPLGDRPLIYIPESAEELLPLKAPRKPTPASMGRALRQVEKAERRATRETELAQRITALPARRYGVILADPAWRFEPRSRETGMDRAADNHYPTMTTEEIKALDVPSIAAPDSVLFLWATAPMLPQALEVLRVWCFDYRSHYVWGKDKFGSGYWSRNKHEILLIGVRGAIPCPAQGTQRDSLIMAPRGEHSAKPECFLEMVESYFPNLPKIELFRRGPPRPGWDAWGNEAEIQASDDSAAQSAEGDADSLAIPGFLRRTASPAEGERV